MTNAELILELKRRFALDASAQVFSWGSWDNHHATVRIGTGSDKMDSELQNELPLTSYPFVLAAAEKSGETFFFFFDDIENSMVNILTVYGHEDNYKEAALFYVSYGDEVALKIVEFGAVLKKDGHSLLVQNFGFITEGSVVDRAVLHQPSNLHLKDYRFSDYSLFDFDDDFDDLPAVTFDGQFSAYAVEVKEISLYNVVELNYRVGDRESSIVGERFFDTPEALIVATEKHTQAEVFKGAVPFAVVDNTIIEPVSVEAINEMMQQCSESWEEVYEMGLER